MQSRFYLFTAFPEQTFFYLTIDYHVLCVYVNFKKKKKKKHSNEMIKYARMTQFINKYCRLLKPMIDYKYKKYIEWIIYVCFRKRFY